MPSSRAIGDLKTLLDQLRTIDPDSWTGVQQWAARTRPLMKVEFPEHVDAFDTYAAPPKWRTRSQRVISRGVDDTDASARSARAAQERTRANVEIARTAKSLLLSSLEGVLALYPREERREGVPPLPPSPDLDFDRKCSLFLQRAYDLTNSGDITMSVSMDDVAADSGLEKSEVRRIASALDEGEFMRLIGSTQVVFTRRGAIEARRVRLEAEQARVLDRQGSPSVAANATRAFMQMAIDEARKSKSEDERAQRLHIVRFIRWQAVDLHPSEGQPVYRARRLGSMSSTSWLRSAR